MGTVVNIRCCSVNTSGCKLGALDEFTKAIDEDDLVVIYFTAEWCNLCKLIAPEFKIMSKEYTKANFYIVDVEKAEEVSMANGIRVVPTFMLFRQNKKIDELNGVDKGKLVEMIQKNLD
ncbi:uncharacterized protein RCH25_036237 [Pelodytes ibericus]